MDKPRPSIDRMELSGFKSIHHASIDLGPLNVFVGAGGAGKSNLISYFALLKAALDDDIHGHVGRQGGPASLLFLGPKKTAEIVADVLIGAGQLTYLYHQRFASTPPDGLNYTFSFQLIDNAPAASLAETRNLSLSTVEFVPDFDMSVRSMFDLIERIGVYHFQDTSLASPLRSPAILDDDKMLRSDGGNLPAVLHRIMKTDRAAYGRIIDAVAHVAPFFEGFQLAPRPHDHARIQLNWNQIGSSAEFGPDQLSDGTLRAIALITVLLQPEAELPELLVVDEPELGLDPHALHYIAGLFKQASARTQVILATQSAPFVAYLDPRDAIVVDRKGNESRFTRLDHAKLEAWLKHFGHG